ncbi:hypothetical protein SBADM41S_01022 [Streptomyces badius]
MDRRCEAEPGAELLGLPLSRGRVDTSEKLQVQGTDYIWAAGDNAQVPDIWSAAAPATRTPGAHPNAQHALRQAKVLGDNVISGMRGFPQKEYSHANKGAVAGLGLHKGVAMIVMGKVKIKLKASIAWYMHRGYHGLAMPTWNRKIRIFADWTLAMFLKREVVSLGAMETPREEDSTRPGQSRPRLRPPPSPRVRRPRPPDPPRAAPRGALQPRPKGPSAIRGADGPLAYPGADPGAGAGGRRWSGPALV